MQSEQCINLTKFAGFYWTDQNGVGIIEKSRRGLRKGLQGLRRGEGFRVSSRQRERYANYAAAV